MPLMDLVNLARTARETLARGLNALQSPGVPPGLMSVAEPIAEAMGYLHRIEASGGAEAGQAAPVALLAARRALAWLQAQPVAHPAVEDALESVAGSLGLVHQLAQSAAPATQPSNLMHYGGREAEPQVAVLPNPGPAAVWQQPARSHQPPPWQQPQPAAQQQWHQPASAAAPPTWNQSSSQPQWHQPAPQPQWQKPEPPPPATAPGWQQTVLSGTDPRPARFEAALGAHSATNFYKGLSGNDVIDSGGLFVATYQIPDIGKNVQLKVSLPGGYEFEALGVVRWTREAPDGGGDAAPGFGVQFTHISPEGRQLVYRYVRNREPIFHDDL
jgi:uncharacterized protein (TIGR02266 family)